MGDATACFDVMTERWVVGKNAAPQWQQSTIASAADIDSRNWGEGVNPGLLNLMTISFDLYTDSMCR